jgi:uncharacterized protein (DUF58 family)
VSAPSQELDRLELHAVGLADALLSGSIPSVFRGEGFEPAGLRLYVPGDDVRALDWRVTARTGRPHVRERLEERDLEVWLVVDRSASLHGGLAPAPGRAALEAAAALAAAACRQGRPLGLLQFTERVEEEVPPDTGRTHVRRTLAALHGLRPSGRGTALDVVLDGLAARLAHRTLVVVVSDFLVPTPSRRDAALAFAGLARRHDLLPVRIENSAVPPAHRMGRVRVADPESGAWRVVDTSDERALREMERAAQDAEEWWKGLVAALGVTSIRVVPSLPLGRQLAAGLLLRRRRGA